MASRKSQNAVCMLNSTDKNKSIYQLIVTAEFHTDQKKGLSIDATNGTDVWSGELKGQELTEILAKYGSSYDDFCTQSAAAFSGFLEDQVYSGGYQITTDHVTENRKPCIRISWKRRNEKEETFDIGSALLSESDQAKEKLQSAFVIALEIFNGLSRRKTEVQRTFQESNQKFQDQREVTRAITVEKRAAYDRMLSMTKCLVDSKLEYSRKLTADARTVGSGDASTSGVAVGKSHHKRQKGGITSHARRSSDDSSASSP